MLIITQLSHSPPTVLEEGIEESKVDCGVLGGNDGAERGQPRHKEGEHTWFGRPHLETVTFGEGRERESGRVGNRAEMNQETEKTRKRGSGNESYRDAIL